jgi:hypothetical protein
VKEGIVILSLSRSLLLLLNVLFSNMDEILYLQLQKGRTVVKK